MRRVPRHTRRRKQIAACAAFGDRLDSGLPNRQTTTPSDAVPHYTGKPNVPGLGYAFLFRNYRASLGKWQTADPMGYSDGWNQLAYCGNGVASAVDLWGGVEVGDIRTCDGYENLPADALSLSMGGYEVSHCLLGFDHSYTSVEYDVVIDYLTKTHNGHEDYYEKVANRQYLLVWRHYDVTVSFRRDTVVSQLLSYTGLVGEIGGALGLILKTSFWYDAGMTVAAYIGKANEHWKETESYRLGYVDKLDNKTPVYSNVHEVFKNCGGITE